MAGGQATRMGGQDKGLVKINDQAMIAYVINALKPQVAGIVINVNRNKSVYRKFGYPVIMDDLTGFQGPACRNGRSYGQGYRPTIFSPVRVTGPLLPDDIVARLYAVLNDQGAEICVAHDGKRMQSVCALVDCKLQDSLQKYLAGEDRKIEHWYEQHKLAQADFSDKQGCFLNVNELHDLAAVSGHLMG